MFKCGARLFVLDAVMTEIVVKQLVPLVGDLISITFDSLIFDVRVLRGFIPPWYLFRGGTETPKSIATSFLRSRHNANCLRGHP